MAYMYDFFANSFDASILKQYNMANEFTGAAYTDGTSYLGRRDAHGP